MFTNSEACKKLRVKDQGDWNYRFDDSKSFSVDLGDKIFGLISHLEPNGMDYDGLLKDLSQVQARLTLQDIIELE